MYKSRDFNRELNDIITLKLISLSSYSMINKSIVKCRHNYDKINGNPSREDINKSQTKCANFKNKSSSHIE
jgi:hypothetical protein